MTEVRSRKTVRDAGQPLLVVENLRTEFNTAAGPLIAVDSVSFTLNEGETLGIVGESGSGKSVLVRTIMGLLPATAVVRDEGRVLFDGIDIRHLSRRETKHFWGTEIAMVFQDPMTSLNPVKKIGTQVTESMRYHLRLSRREATARALDLLHQVGISEPRRRLEQYPHELSGGMRQRVTIAVALACEPRLLIADEPTTALDVTVQKQILDLLGQLQQDRDMAMILISHDLGIVGGMTDRVAVMYAGQFVELAATAALLQNVEHPYTEALLSATPDLENPSHTRLLAISGRAPQLINPPTGCRFAPRCRHAQPACVDSSPILVEGVEPDHFYRCLYPVGTPEGRNALARNIAIGRTVVGLQLHPGAVS
jgi:peptide/nickel transport system ATP-binding protein